MTKRLRKGSEVKVITGKHKGEISKVEKVDKKNNKVYLKGINQSIDYAKGEVQEKRGERRVKIMPIHISNIKIVD